MKNNINHGSKEYAASGEAYSVPQSPASDDVPTTAFAVHGISTPGVKLMRDLQFVYKATLICLMFSIPLAWITWSLYDVKLGSIGQSGREQIGLAYLRAAMPLQDALQQVRAVAYRQAAGNPADGAPGLAAALRAGADGLAQQHSVAGAALGDGAAYAQLQEGLKGLSQDGAQSADVAAKATAVLAQLMALQEVVIDNSALALDRDPDSYHLMDAALVQQPQLLESMARLRDLALVAHNGAAPANGALMELLAVADLHFQVMRADLSKALKNQPALAQRVGAAVDSQDVQAYFDLLRQSALTATDVSADLQSRWLAAADQAIAGQHTLGQGLRGELDVLLSERLVSMRTDLYVTSGVLVLGLLLAGYLFHSFFLVTRGGLQLISRHLQEMASGDLRKPPGKPWGKDEPAHVIFDLRIAYDSLLTLIHKVRNSAAALNAASEEISASSVDLSRRTEASAQSLEQQAIAMDNIGTTVRATAERARMAATFAQDNAHVAEGAGKVFEEVVSTMREIQTSSSQIGDIIGVIDGIAFQTNILALNAAVEAARAGESGRGFAVVASEVRGLAGRSAKAAQEIKGLIATSVSKVEGGTRVVEQAGSSMTEVVTNARQINQFLSEISTAARAQAESVDAVGRSIQELDKSTQSNAALVEETTSSSAVLATLATTLQEEVANFKVL